MEFHFVMEEFNRMQQWYKENLKPNPYQEGFNFNQLGTTISFSDFEKIVMDWSKTHPRPKYPRFIDILDDMIQIAGNKDWKNLSLNELLMQEIPQNVAEDYGIAPLNLCDINKYCDEDLESDWR